MANTHATKVHNGYLIQSEEEGFFWDAGVSAGGGYFDTLDEAKFDIDSYIAEEKEHYISMHEDTPSLGNPWWSTK